MGIPAGVRLPKSTLVVVAIYILCSAIQGLTKAFQQLRSVWKTSSISSSVNKASKGSRSAWKTQPWSRIEGVGVLCVVCQGEVGEEDDIWELRECLHSFHKGCLDGWVEEGHCTCPLCRSEF